MNEECCANCEYWVEVYQKCDHPEQLAYKADDYAAMPEDSANCMRESKVLKMNETRGLWRGKTMPKYNGEEFNEVWVEGDLIHSENRYYIHPVANAVKVQSELGKLIIMHEVDPTTLGECAGIPDKNSKLIFEGDVIQYETQGIIERYIVCRNDESALFAVKGLSGLVIGDFTFFDPQRCEIIGNIHDSHDLLESEGTVNDNEGH